MGNLLENKREREKEREKVFMILSKKSSNEEFK